MRSADGTPLGQFLSVACFAERSVMPAAAAVPIPTSLPFWQAALVGGAVVTGVGAVRNAARVEACQAVCVVGCGGVGLQVIAGARLAGADPIIAIDLAPGKLELAEARGATQFVDGAEGDVARAVRGISSGVDHAFEVVGRPETVSLAWNTVKPGGTATVVGVVPDGVDVAIDARGLLAEQSLRGLFYGSGHPAREIADLADLIDRGGFDVESTISHATNLLGVGAALERMRHSDGARTIVVIDEELVGPLPERLRV
ncbi:MAG: zinc-binding dehydrogenase [Acidobacteria bacterium]|nr:zinc-binding dehydrogenase [Acidobacteriota bacterium]